MQQAAQLILNLVKGKRKVPVVTDDESVIVQAIGKYLPQAVHVSCWNHAINAMKVWLKKHGATAARSRTDKKSGRKAPRPSDFDINPAPDSIHEVKQHK